MAPAALDPEKVRAFKDAASFYQWLARHHDKDGGNGAGSAKRRTMFVISRAATLS